MRQHHDTFEIPTTGPGLVDVTARVARVVADAGIRDGQCTLFVQHTSASLTVQENADPAVRRDLQAALGRLAPEDEALYEHDAEGPDDMPAHVRAALTLTSLTVPVFRGHLRLGTWQAIYLWEHRRRGSLRQVAVHVMGE